MDEASKQAMAATLSAEEAEFSAYAAYVERAYNGTYRSFALRQTERCQKHGSPSSNHGGTPPPTRKRSYYTFEV